MVEPIRQEGNSGTGVCSARLLIVDTAGPDLTETAQLLRKVGYNCDAIDDVSRGRELLGAESYELLITDINLPDGQGRQLIEYAQSIAPGMPVVVVTACPCLDSAIQSVELSVAAYLAKSESPSVLCDKIRTTLVKTANGRALLRIQRRLRECASDLGDGSTPSRRGASRTSDPGIRVPISTLRTLAGCLSELVALEASADATGQISRVCELLQCPIWRVQRRAIHKCILLLQETKRRFKSKELAQVREILDGLLKTLG